MSQQRPYGSQQLTCQRDQRHLRGFSLLQSLVPGARRGRTPRRHLGHLQHDPAQRARPMMADPAALPLARRLPHRASGPHSWPAPACSGSVRSRPPRPGSPSPNKPRSPARSAANGPGILRGHPSSARFCSAIHWSSVVSHTPSTTTRPPGSSEPASHARPSCRTRRYRLQKTFLMQHCLQLVLGLRPLLAQRDPQPRQQTDLLGAVLAIQASGSRSRATTAPTSRNPPYRSSAAPTRSPSSVADAPSPAAPPRAAPPARTPAKTRSPPSPPAAARDCRNHAADAAPVHHLLPITSCLHRREVAKSLVKIYSYVGHHGVPSSDLSLCLRLPQSTSNTCAYFRRARQRSPGGTPPFFHHI